MRCCLVLLVATVAGSLGCQAPIEQDGASGVRRESPRIELVSEGTDLSRFEILNLEPQAIDAFEVSDRRDDVPLLEVFVASAAADAPALGGTLTVVAGRPTFTPRYPLQGGLKYRAVLHLGRLAGNDPQSGDLVAEFAIPKPPPQPPTALEHIYPARRSLPENQLKFYLHFSAPMSRGEAYRRIHLVDQDGREVEGAFLELGEELWDPAMRRFTLLCDPGRVKRGLKPREEFGPVLEEGKRYALVVDRGWPDANGTPLVRETRKAISTLAPDDTPIDPATWQVESPTPAGTEPLVVRFGEPLDHSLALRLIKVADASGQSVAGSAELVEEETCWRFTPAQPWQAGDYRLVVDTALEDLAGNAVGRAFDADVFGKVQKRIEARTVEVPFEITVGEH